MTLFAVVVPKLRVPAEATSNLPVEAGIVTTPAVVTFKPVDAKAKVPEEFPIAVLFVPLELIFAVAPVTVIPAEPVSKPPTVTASEPAVEVKVVPVLVQYPSAPEVGAVEVKFFEPSV